MLSDIKHYIDSLAGIETIHTSMILFNCVAIEFVTRSSVQYKVCKAQKNYKDSLNVACFRQWNE